MSSASPRRLKDMTDDVPVTLALPIAERAAALAFYRDALGLEPFGELGSDGIPEPLRFAVNEGLTLMLIPTRGFGWVIGDREVAEPWACECLLSLDAPDPAGVATSPPSRSRSGPARSVDRGPRDGLLERLRRAQRAQAAPLPRSGLSGAGHGAAGVPPSSIARTPQMSSARVTGPGATSTCSRAPWAMA